MMRPNRADRMFGNRAWVSCNAGRTFKSITGGELLEIHGINRLVPGDAHIVEPFQTRLRGRPSPWREHKSDSGLQGLFR
jgi:hypothetical protein